VITDLHCNGDGGNTAGIPRFLQVKLVVIPRVWSDLLQGYRGDGTDFHGNTTVVNVHKVLCNMITVSSVCTILTRKCV